MRVRVLLAILCLALSSALTELAPAQYIYMDTNGDGVYTEEADTLNAIGSTSIDIWLDTDSRRTGEDAICPTIDGPLSINSYTLVLRAQDGTVSWGPFTNGVSSFGIPIGESSSDDLFYTGFGGSASLPRGLYFLGSITVSTTSGTPGIVFLSQWPGSPVQTTSFGSACSGLDFDNTLKLGQDWFDSDGIVTATKWTVNGAPLSRNPGLPQQLASPPVASSNSGAIAVWVETQGSGSTRVMGQMVDSLGRSLWPRDGSIIADAAGDQLGPVAVSDGAGGAIVAWTDYRSGGGDIYAQRVDQGGASLWTTNGVPICTATGNQDLPRAIPDGSGGAIFVWSDSRGSITDLYTQRVSSAGTASWTANGVSVSASGVAKADVDLCADGSGGVILAWTELQDGGDVKTQRLDGSGALQWGGTGLLVSGGTGRQGTPSVVSDNSGGAILVWQTPGADGHPDLVAHRIGPTGTFIWPLAVPVVVAPQRQLDQRVAQDGANGAVVVWHDFQQGDQTGYVYAQRIAPGGSLNWTANGVAVATVPDGRTGARIARSGTGGAIITWIDGRPEFPTVAPIFYQVLGPDGSPLMNPNGAVLCGVGIGKTPADLCFDGGGGAIAVWSDFRNGINYRPYAARVLATGRLVTAAETPSITSPKAITMRVQPNPFNPRLRVYFRSPVAGPATLSVFTASGRMVRRIPLGTVSVGENVTTWDGRDDRGVGVATGRYYLQLAVGGLRQRASAVLLK